MQIPEILLSQPFELENGEIARNFYREGIGFGTIQAQQSQWRGKEATVTFHDRPDIELSEPVYYTSFTASLLPYERIADLQEEVTAYGLTKSAIKIALSSRRTEITNQFIPAIDTSAKARGNLMRILNSVEFIY